MRRAEKDRREQRKYDHREDMVDNDNDDDDGLDERHDAKVSTMKAMQFFSLI